MDIQSVNGINSPQIRLSNYLLCNVGTYYYKKMRNNIQRDIYSF